MNKKVLGRHILIDYYGCDQAILKDTLMLKENLMSAARKVNATIITDLFHTFSPYGVSGVIIIAESHIAIHTWPEHQCAVVDFFSCTETIDLNLIVDILKASFKSTHLKKQIITRGEI